MSVSESVPRWLVPPRGLGLPVIAALGMVVLLAVGGLVWNVSDRYGRLTATSAAGAPVPRTSDATTGPQIGTVPTGPPNLSRIVSRPLSPNRITIPALNETAPIVNVGTDAHRELEIPQNPRTVGWWSPGAKPGSTVGTAVIAGHINYAGVSGAFARIGTLRPGDVVQVYGAQNAGAAKSVRFTVTGVRTYHKTHLPYQQIFDQQVTGRLAIVTCGGPFDAATGNYLDNIVVYAVPSVT